MKTNEAIEYLTEAIINKKPLVLFAGQSIEYRNDKENPILKALLEKIDCDLQEFDWRSVLKKGLSDLDMSWVSERFDRNVPPPSVEAVYDAPWSAIFTSSIDPRFAKRFSTRGRQPESVLSRETYARVSRSRSRPPVYYLLGKSNETAPDTRAPQKLSDLKRRIRLHAIELLNRIVDTATVRGLVIIAGYEAENDLLPVDDLLAPLSEQHGLQVLWFGSLDTSLSDLAVEMIERGDLICIQATLSSVLNQLLLEKKVSFDDSASPDEPGMVSITNGALNITAALRLRVEASASIVEDSWTEDIGPLDGSALEQAFYAFHGDLGSFRTLIEGISQGFAITRDFEETLWKTVESTTKKLHQSDGAIIIHGQSGSGKSIGLARLALRIRRELKLPVVVATNRIPTYADIDAFCAEAERCGAAASVVICDANQPPHRYNDLASALQSRGRRALIVGTSYKLEKSNHRQARRFVEAPAKVSADEVRALQGLISRFWHTSTVVFDKTNENTSILAMLYRNLSAGRERLTAGVSEEARAAESTFRERSRSTPATVYRGALAEALIKAEVADASFSIFNEDPSLAQFGEDAAGKLIDYVMAAGRIGCPIPVNLAMRTLQSNTHSLDLTQIVHLFSDLDLFRWRDSGGEASELLVSARLQLEAELICRRRLGDKSREINCIIDLIRNVRPTGVDREAERVFLLDLLQKLDREGPLENYYQSGYLLFANALRELREKHGVVDAALMLRECVFRRQTVWSLDGKDSTADIPEEERLAILNDARATVEKALQLISEGKLKASKRTRVNLSVERATIYGYLAVQRIRSNDVENCWSDYLAARAATAKSIALTNDYHAFDVALWTSSDILKSGNLPENKKIEVLADIAAAMDLVDESSLSDNQKIRYLDRRNRVGNVIADHRLSQEAIERLAVVAPAAATFLIAKNKAAPLYIARTPYDDKLRKLAGEISKFIGEKISVDREIDPRCHRLMLQLLWAEATGERLLHQERGRTPANRAAISSLLHITKALNSHFGAAVRNQDRFLEAVLLWLAGNVNQATDAWRSLSRDTEYEDRSRVIRRLVATDADGIPIKFNGRVEASKGGSDFRVRLEGTSTTVGVLERDFRENELAHGRELKGFGMAFNYVGPIADPLTRLVRK